MRSVGWRFKLMAYSIERGEQTCSNQEHFTPPCHQGLGVARRCQRLSVQAATSIVRRMQVRQDVLRHKHDAAGVGDSVLLEVSVTALIYIYIFIYIYIYIYIYMYVLIYTYIYIYINIHIYISAETPTSRRTESPTPAASCLCRRTSCLTCNRRTMLVAACTDSR